ncbi:GNAT family N-acetyltransferase [Magnetospirillum sulfuroxidans]|uniref:GNAT family N-acetyltransferase n=1 Tax=Magnetospirillum sulfuroxidans TaxID=611300 RepID=A0ABS5IF23_9PROT|nr:GNAT family N-acetyltransferase [Magnetospirillum sulfuroxidans]MBR9973016.1 GNAT family N-acetyltransferase [Magnetospirillum sulfuroxidans]
MSLPPAFTIAPMRADEVPILEEWAAQEGWNPGLADLAIAHAVDPDAFIALRQGGELVGGGTIFSYSAGFGFMGLFIIRADLRGGGLGAQLWHHRLNLLRRRLVPGASIGMDGVFAMAPFYEKGGFRLAHRDLRFEGVAHGVTDPAIQAYPEISFAEIETYDHRFFPVSRAAFLLRWLEQPGAHVRGLRQGDSVVGYGVARPCRSGFKLGPVFADNPASAERLIGSLLAAIPGEKVALDIPEPNGAGLELAAKFGLTQSFGCARMYHGPAPDLPLDGIFGVTSFEFG